VPNATRRAPITSCSRSLKWSLPVKSAKSASARTRASLRRGTDGLWTHAEDAKQRSDEYCPHCDNHFVLDALTPKASLQVEGEDVRKDARYTAHMVDSEPRLIHSRMIRDERVRADVERPIFDVKDAADRLG
jgi:hypothetical protein